MGELNRPTVSAPRRPAPADDPQDQPSTLAGFPAPHCRTARGPSCRAAAAGPGGETRADPPGRCLDSRRLRVPDMPTVPAALFPASPFIRGPLHPGRPLHARSGYAWRRRPGGPACAVLARGAGLHPTSPSPNRRRPRRSGSPSSDEARPRALTANVRSKRGNSSLRSRALAPTRCSSAHRSRNHHLRRHHRQGAFREARR